MTDRTENTTQKNNELNKRHKILNSVLCLLAIWLMALIFGDSLLYAVKPVIPTAITAASTPAVTRSLPFLLISFSLSFLSSGFCLSYNKTQKTENGCTHFRFL